MTNKMKQSVKMDTIPFYGIRKVFEAGVQHLLHLKSKSKILRPIEIMGFFL